MDNLKRLSVVALATTVGVMFAPEKASAVIIVDTMDGTEFSPRDITFSNEQAAEQTALLQGFSITDASILNTAALRGFSEGADITIAIIQMIGPGTEAGDVLFEQVFSVIADGIGTSIRTFNLGGLILGVGDYFFVVMSEDPIGFEWAKVDRAGSVNINDRGASTFLSGMTWYSQVYTFQDGKTAPVFTLEIDGDVVPAPGSVMLMIGACAGFSVRRQRR